jgi:hypothetical protein
MIVAKGRKRLSSWLADLACCAFSIAILNCPVVATVHSDLLRSENFEPRGLYNQLLAHARGRLASDPIRAELAIAGRSRVSASCRGPDYSAGTWKARRVWARIGSQEILPGPRSSHFGA